MENNLFNLFRIPETRERIFRTLGLLICYRVGFQVPLPGMSIESLGRGSEGIFGLLSALSGGAFGQTTIFALGIMPFISASIIFSMLTKVSPTLEAVAKEGAAGQKKINQWTRLATVPIALIQGLLVYTGVFMRYRSEMVVASMQSHPLGLAAIVIFGLVAGALLVMWIGELITEYGVGNGASLIIMAGIIAQMPVSLYQISGSSDFYQTLMFMAFVWIITIFVVVFMHKGARRVPIQYARLTRGRRVYGGQRHYLPLKVNMAGVMPIIFASVLFVIPGILFNWLGWSRMKTIFQDQTGFVYVTVYGGLIFSFSFFWNRLMFQPEEIANNLREHGSFIPGIRPGAKTAEFLSNVLTRVTLAGAAFLAMVAVLPNFITEGTGLTMNMRYFLGGTSVLIVVGVALELVDKLNAQLVMRQYDGGLGAGAGASWTKTDKG